MQFNIPGLSNVSYKLTIVKLVFNMEQNNVLKLLRNETGFYNKVNIKTNSNLLELQERGLKC